ncbi:MAG: ROK family glucokinase [Candidatus Hydrogenedentota bacterium]
MSRCVLGIDLGGTGIKTALVSESKEIFGQEMRPTEADKGLDVVIDNMVASVEAVIQSSGVNREDLVAVGVGAPGPLNWQTGVVYSPPNLPGWKDVPLAELISERLGMPCFLENDANAACYGEFWMGAGQGVETMCLLTLGTGVGGGIVTFGSLLRGQDGTAGEIGHIKVQRDGRSCGCGSKGCLESYASVSGMVRTAREGLDGGADSVLRESCNSDLDTLSGKMISEAAANGDAFAQSVIHETGIWLGIGIGSLINLFNPEKVVLCGGMIAAGDALFDPVRQIAFENAFEVPAKRAQIIPGALGNDSGVLGCAGVALERFEDTPVL